MAIIPRYTSRALPPGAQPGMIENAQQRGRAGARLAAAAGDTIIAGIDFKKRKDAAKAAEQAYRTQVLQEIKGATATIGDSLEGYNPEENIPDGPRGDWNSVFGGSTPAGNTSTAMAAKTGSSLFARTDQQIQVGGTLDGQSEKVSLGSFETTILGFGVEAKAALNQSGTPAKGATERALVAFDRKVLELSEGIENRPHLKAPFDALVASVRAPLEFRLLGHENARRVDEDKAALAESLGGLAQAAVHDPAMAPGVTGRGFAQIESAMQAGMLDAEEAAAMQGAFAENVHMSAMRGQIATAPEDMQTRLVAGDFDDIFDAPARDRLIGEARTTARLKTAGASATARARRRGLEIDMEDHLAALDATGAGDEAVAARAQAELPDFQYATFQASQAQARERHATRAEYAFMTEAGIEADIAQRAEGGPANIDRRDGDQRAADHATRTAIRDEVLTARATDPAGWAMRDDAVAAAYQAAQENPDNPALARNASQQRIALQREMGIEQPRLLSDAERDEIAGQLAQATPADRPALIADLRGRYGAQANMLAAELTGEVDANTALLIAHADMPQLPRLLAQGMEKAKTDGPATLTLASPEALNDLPPLPIIDKGEQAGRKLDMAVLKPGQHYRAAAGGVLRYDGEALIPVTVEGAASNPAAPNAPTPPLPLGGGAQTRTAGGGRWKFTVPDEADASPQVKAGYETAEAGGESSDVVENAPRSERAEIDSVVSIPSTAGRLATAQGLPGGATLWPSADNRPAPVDWVEAGRSIAKASPRVAAGIGTAASILLTPWNAREEYRYFGDDGAMRLRTAPGDLYGTVERLDPDSGDWTETDLVGITVGAGAGAGAGAGTLPSVVVGTQEQVDRAPMTLPDGQLLPPPGLIPPDIPDTSRETFPAVENGPIVHVTPEVERGADIEIFPIPESGPPQILIFPDMSRELASYMILENKKGNAATKAHIDSVRDLFLDSYPGWEHTDGGREREEGEEMREYWVPGPARTFIDEKGKRGDGRPGGKWADLTFESPSGAIVHIQTVDVDKNGKPTDRELNNAEAIRRATRHTVILIPKPTVK